MLIDYKKILKEIKPDEAEKKKVKTLSDDLIQFINQRADAEKIDAEAVLVGSVAKETWLSGKADIDIFIKFPLETSPDNLKEKGLFLGHECIKKNGAEYEMRYASHPYVTGFIQGYQIDFVPCYNIKSSKELKSAVDRTLLHTIFMQDNLKSSEADEVILLKKFMASVGTYGSEFKVGGFAGYLCELLILHYKKFEKILLASQNEWKPGHKIDLLGHGTAHLYSDPLVVVDPVDPKRNVAAALTLQKMSEFMAAARNFLKNPKPAYFRNKKIKVQLNSLKAGFKQRGTKSYILIFKTPDIPADALFPQIKKTENSMVSLVEREDFKVSGSSSWTDEKEKAVILLEFDVCKLPLMKKHPGPYLWSGEHQERFLDKYDGNVWVEYGRWMTEVKRNHIHVETLLESSLNNHTLGILKFGKHIKDIILKEHDLRDLSEYLDSNDLDREFLLFLHGYLKKNEILWR